MWTVYKHENLETHQVYIGITEQEPVLRWGKNGKGYRKQSKFFDAILEYGWKNFSHEILFTNIKSELEARKIETNLIVKYDAIQNGYNSCKSTNEEILSNKRIFHQKTQYIDLSTGKIYDTMATLASDLKVTTSAVSRYLSKNYESTCNGHIIYERGYFDSLSKEQQKILLNKAKQKKIKCIETNEIFDTPKQAGLSCSDKDSSKAYILKACRTGCTAYKKHWTFV